MSHDLKMVSTFQSILYYNLMIQTDDSEHKAYWYVKENTSNDIKTIYNT